MQASQQSDLSVVSAATTRSTALDVCYSVYGETAIQADAVEKFYEANAMYVSITSALNAACSNFTFFFVVLCRYENPFVTATSRSVIADIHRLSRQFTSVDVPRPLAVLSTLFRLKLSNPTSSLFQALRVWTDVIDICENESFDGHRRVIVEHSLNILLLPGLHCEGHLGHRVFSSNDSALSTDSSPHGPSSHPFIVPSLPVPGTSLSIPSPLHLKLRIVTRLSFNEQGLVTHHRDIWDVKDVIGLFPGVSLAQWIGTRLTASGLSYVSKLMGSGQKSNSKLDLESGL